MRGERASNDEQTPSQVTRGIADKPRGGSSFSAARQVVGIAPRGLPPVGCGDWAVGWQNWRFCSVVVAVTQLSGGAAINCTKWVQGKSVR